MTVRTFDLAAFEAAQGAARSDRAAALDAMCRETGFVILTGHGVPGAVIDGVWEAARAFFAQPVQVKARVAPVRKGDPYGYLGPKAEALAASKGVVTPPDLKESFNGGPLSVPADASDEARAFCYAPTPWPDVPGFKSAWIAYYLAMERLAARIMAAFAAALGLPEDHFAAAIAQPISALRALHYPATTVEAEPDQQRAGAHTDYGTLTILLPQTRVGGLQIYDQSGNWKDLADVPGAFVINIGDLMARWTSDRWVSTLHRVVARPGQSARQSLAFFHQPGWDVEITPLDGGSAYPPVRSGPYLMEKFRATGL